jgi:hypothetical protein
MAYRRGFGRYRRTQCLPASVLSDYFITPRDLQNPKGAQVTGNRTNGTANEASIFSLCYNWFERTNRNGRAMNQHEIQHRAASTVGTSRTNIFRYGYISDMAEDERVSTEIRELAQELLVSMKAEKVL